jgi:hypothetical protein
MCQAKINLAYDRGLYAYARYQKARMEYREQGRPFDERLRQLSNAAVEEERQQNKPLQRKSK